MDGSETHSRRFSVAIMFRLVSSVVLTTLTPSCILGPGDYGAYGLTYAAVHSVYDIAEMQSVQAAAHAGNVWIGASDMDTAEVRSAEHEVRGCATRA